ncbi:Phosphatidylinositol-specific phospholipase C X domain-containing protein [Plasmodiophora brassicae]
MPPQPFGHRARRMPAGSRERPVGTGLARASRRHGRRHGNLVVRRTIMFQVVIGALAVAVGVAAHNACLNCHDANLAVQQALMVGDSHRERFTAACRSCYDRHTLCVEQSPSCSHVVGCEPCGRAFMLCSGLRSHPSSPKRSWEGSTAQPNFHWRPVPVPWPMMASSITSIGVGSFVVVSGYAAAPVLMRLDRDGLILVGPIPEVPKPSGVSLDDGLGSDRPPVELSSSSSSSSSLIIVLTDNVEGILYESISSSNGTWWSLPQALPSSMPPADVQHSIAIRQETLVVIAYVEKQSGQVVVAVRNDAGMWMPVAKFPEPAGAAPAIEVAFSTVHIVYPRASDMSIVHAQLQVRDWTLADPKVLPFKTKAPVALSLLASRIVAIMHSPWSSELQFAAFSLASGTWSAPASTSAVIDAFTLPVLVNDGIRGRALALFLHHSKLHVLAGDNLDIAPSSWMHDMRAYVANVPMVDLTIPGSHDAGSFAITDESPVAPDGIPYMESISRLPLVGHLAKQVAARWSIAQGRTILEQLRSGIRYLDLRVTVGSHAVPPVARDDSDPLVKDLFIMHELIGGRIVDAIAQIAQFLDENPHEVVLVDFVRVLDVDRARLQALYDHLEQTFSHRLAPVVIPAQRVTLQSLWQTRRQIIVFRDCNETWPLMLERPWLWPRNVVLDSPWADVPTIGGLRPRLDEFVERRNATKWFVLQGICTEDSGVIERGLFQSPKTLRESASIVTPSVLDWMHSWPPLNIIMVDWAEDSALVSRCLSANLNRLGGRA